MKTDVQGKLRNTRLATTRPLLPLFEAIINSLQAIEERNTSDRGEILIQLERADPPQQRLDSRETAEAPVTAFAIEDSGIGFTDANFESFNTSESTHKAKRGGKGIGRFLWLKAFDTVSVTSTYQDAEQWKTRAFRFETSDEGVADAKISKSEATESRTRVQLSGMKTQFQRNCPKLATTIAQKVVEHCFSYFYRGEAPRMQLRDRDETIDINELYAQMLERVIAEKTFKVRENEFSIVVLRLRPSEDPAHHLHYFADRRQVTKEQLARFIPNLASRLHDEDGAQFVCSVHLYGDYLDKTVTPERQEFSFMGPDQTQSDMFLITADELREAALEVVSNVLEPYLAPVRDAKEARIRDYVDRNAPEFRAVMKHKIEVLERVAPDATNETIDAQLYQAKKELEAEVRTFSASTTRDGARYAHFLEMMTDLTQSDLVRYVVHRRVILEELEKALSSTESGYPKEEAVHQLIYPMRATSEDVVDDQQNLWIIDERLVYHRFLASDKEMYKTIEDSRSAERPDIVIFNHPIAISEGNNIGSVVVLEFKRPMRANYSDEENPLEQVLDYMAEIREKGKVKTYRGRVATVSDACPFYATVLCDITPKIEKFCMRGNYRKTPDGLGFYAYHDVLRAYVEVVSYEKMLNDAKKRNRAFFDKLGIPLR